MTPLIAVAGALLLTPPVLLLARAHSLQGLPLGRIATAATAASVGLVAVVAVAPADPVRLVSVGLLAILGLAAAVVDLTEGRLPNGSTARCLPRRCSCWPSPVS